MKKIPSLFQRNYDTDRLVRNEVVPGCEWVLANEGRATEKIDGTSCLLRDGKLYKCYELKKGKKPPAGFEATQDADPITGDVPGWVPVNDGPDDKWHHEGLQNVLAAPDLYHDTETQDRANGTYELVGPKVQGNPYGLPTHDLWRHGLKELPDATRDFDSLREYLRVHEIEGIVWHHPGGRMCKIKRRDFGFPWPIK